MFKQSNSVVLHYFYSYTVNTTVYCQDGDKMQKSYAFIFQVKGYMKIF